MNDVKQLLDRALADAPGLSHHTLVDPSDDVARGRRRLRRRSLAAGAGGAATVLTAAGVLALALNGTGAASPAVPTPGSGRPSSVAAAPSSAHPASSSANLSIALVAYTGKQPPGYSVAEVPQGWVVQGGDPYALTLAPRNAKNKDYSFFAGKLVVMLQSRDFPGAPTRGTVQEVAGRPGRFDVQGDTQMLTCQIADGRWVVVQAPTSLGWDSARLARFAEGVHVLGNAQGARG